MSEFAAGLVYGAGIGLIAAVAALYLADLIWPAFPNRNKGP